MGKREAEESNPTEVPENGKRVATGDEDDSKQPEKKGCR